MNALGSKSILDSLHAGDKIVNLACSGGSGAMRGFLGFPFDQIYDVPELNSFSPSEMLNGCTASAIR